jgi:hypothetical protein
MPLKCSISNFTASSEGQCTPKEKMWQKYEGCDNADTNWPDNCHLSFCYCFPRSFLSFFTFFGEESCYVFRLVSNLSLSDPLASASQVAGFIGTNCTGFPHIYFSKYLAHSKLSNRIQTTPTETHTHT